MTEILTESFCERCGTRYTFESAAPGQRRLGGLKVLGRGLKHFVLSDDSTLDESIAAARSDLERDATNHQLDAFHRTFSFCMSCRQYTCANCWNSADARCLSCAPLDTAEPEPVADAEIEPDRLLRFMGGVDDHDHDHVEAHAEPYVLSGTADVPADADVDASPVDIPTRNPPWARSDSAGALDDAPSAPSVMPRTLGGLAAGQSLDDAIAEYEATFDRETPTDTLEKPRTEPGAPESTHVIEAETVDHVNEAEHAPESGVAPDVAEVPLHVDADIDAHVAADRTLELAPPDIAPVRPAPAPIESEPAPAPVESEPVAAEVLPVAADPEPASAPAGTSIDSVVQPVWQAPTTRQPAAPPQWPTGPRWPTGDPARTTTDRGAAPVDALAALMSHSATDAMWAASSREMLKPAATTPTVAAIQACGNCGLSLSATARFCRRCGTPQG